MSASKLLAMAWVLQAAVVTASAQPLTLITPTNTTWRYFTNGTDPGAEWALPGFDDSSWPNGRGLFGNDSGYPYSFNTLIPGPAFGGPLTVYFRTHFTWNNPRAGVILAGTNYVDDGLVMYLNGTEISRWNMPEGVPLFNTTTPVSPGEPVIVQMAISLDNLTNGNPNPLAIGDNVLAVEVHNQGLGSSDVVFGMSLFPAPDFPCSTDGIQPTNRTVLEGRSTTFIVATCFPNPTFQWYRNVGDGEELIFGATSSSFTLTNAIQEVDDGVYYCRLSNLSGVADSRQALLTILSDDQPPRFLLASVVGPGLHTFRLTTDEPLCADAMVCGAEFDFQFNWQINQSDNLSIDLGVADVIQINPTTYEFTTSNPRDPLKQYQITVTPLFGEISDLFGNRIQPGTFAETYPTLTFIQGVGGYAGTQDAEIHSNATADTVQGTAAIVTVDNDDAGIAQGLLRFDNIFGGGPTQIPLGSQIISATLTLNQVDQGSAANFHRMLVPWDQTIATWNSLVSGVANDDVEAVAASDAISVNEPFDNGPMSIDVTASLRAWAYGQINYGWAIRSTGSGGWDWNTSESGAATAPMLTVAYHYIDECGIIVPTFITHPPASLFVAEGQAFTLSVSLSNVVGMLQWTRNGVDIPGANSPTYRAEYATASDAGTYRLSIRCRWGVVAISNPSVVTIGHAFPPYLTEAAAESDGVTITLNFSEPLNAASAQNPANYTFVPPLDVTGAVLSGNTVTLTTTLRELSPNYTLRIANVRDISTLGTVISPNPTFVTLTTARVVLPWDTAGWFYNTNNLDGTLQWKDPVFVPGTDWGTGSGLFGAESSSAVLAAAPAPIATPLAPNSVVPGDGLVTTYFRKTIDLPALPAGARYVIIHYTDDGFIAYLDGQEIHRFAMAAGPVAFTNRSTGIPTGDATHRSFTFNATPGTHTLAVELHQAGVTSSDVLFGMEVRMVGGTSPALSIGQSGFGDVNLNWNADGNWRLRNAAALSGHYLDVTIPIWSRLGSYTLPAASVTNRSFWLLDYTGRP